MEFKITLPVSAEMLGRWLEDNQAKIEIACMMGAYHVHINRHRHESHVEKGRLSVTRSSDIEVSSYGEELEVVLLAALEKCAEEK